jgi:hypothetical protein
MNFANRKKSDTKQIGKHGDSIRNPELKTLQLREELYAQKSIGFSCGVGYGPGTRKSRLAQRSRCIRCLGDYRRCKQQAA